MASNQQHATLNSGHKMPLVGLGTWQDFSGVPAGQVKNAVISAVESGYRHIDTAAVYGVESEVGEALDDLFARKIVKREDLFITSKLWNTLHDPAHVKNSLLKTLKDLRTTYLDLYLIHFPLAWEFTGYDLKVKVTRDPTTGMPKFAKVPISDTWKAMESLVDEGLVRSIGISNFGAVAVVDLLSYARIKPAVNQIEVSPHNVKADLVTICQNFGIHVTGYSVLGSNSRAMLSLDLIKQLAVKYNKSPAQVVLRWAIQRGVSVLPKSANADRQKENLAVFDFSITDDEVKAINALDKQTTVFDRNEMWGFNPFAI